MTYFKKICVPAENYFLMALPVSAAGFSQGYVALLLVTVVISLTAVAVWVV